MLEIFKVDIANGVTAGKQARALLRFFQNNMTLTAVHLLLKNLLNKKSNSMYFILPAGSF